MQEPGIMPLDREAWFKQLNLSNFVNAFYQYRDVTSLGSQKRILVVGPGQGLDTVIFQWRGFDVTTFDVDATFKPSVIGSVHSMQCFDDQQFDIVIASHVLEHLPIDYLEPSLREISRVGRFALIYLPVAGRHGQLRFIAGLHDIELNIIWDIYNYCRKPDGRSAAFCERQHYWEVGRRGYRLADVRRVLAEHFHVLRDYRNRDWLPSHNFVLRSRFSASGEQG